jgi:hypothetical protein
MQGRIADTGEEWRFVLHPFAQLTEGRAHGTGRHAAGVSMHDSPV